MHTKWVFLVAPLILGACAVTSPPPQPVEAPVSRAQQIEAQKQVSAPQVKTLKRKIAIGRFTNETRYGKTFQIDANQDPLGKQASDMLNNRLISSNKFLTFERSDLEKIKSEQALLKEGNLIGVDTLILGSVTEFGRSTSGKSGFLSSTKIQIARAKVEIRLVDARTGYLFFTATGTGEASTESGEVAGFGSRADYDGTLNDRAIGAAISDVQNALISKLEERPWRTDILKVSGRQIFISGGARQGLKVGDVLVVMQQGETVKSNQTGFAITLPPALIGKIRVTSLFGDNETNEGAIGELVSGDASAAKGSTIFVAENKE
ncbi:CsgG/HfaB family protein [Herminiimonas fonticola]|uniref:Curli biogenesis system outer membrane secretion channel CsgG n=1 Tax=Herminiimonas fonticola TaxID=303380 RepID=A0A4R6G3L7_9BURK|nr:CsgG/HfaB family protein [Herminiimonas fonticola]RBA23214.1 Curli production assembly/transport component CsgG [Herminiimonas fonticola]TDN88933.1 curli biogenesis system outer membrane secretion channel CsgG [Herminiimonas fonticola]